MRFDTIRSDENDGDLTAPLACLPEEPYLITDRIGEHGFEHKALSTLEIGVLEGVGDPSGVVGVHVFTSNSDTSSSVFTRGNAQLATEPEPVTLDR